MALQALASDEGQYAAKLENDVLDERDGIDLEPDKAWPWFDYTFNANNKYYIHIQWKVNKASGSWQKYGARRCTINGEKAHIILLKDTRGDNSYSSNEYVSLRQGDQIFNLYFIPGTILQGQWCLDISGKGVICGVTRTNNGQIESAH